MLTFDFGKPKELIIREQKKYRRQRHLSSNVENNSDHNSGMLSQGSFIFKEYSVPDRNEINQKLRGHRDFKAVDY